MILSFIFFIMMVVVACAFLRLLNVTEAKAESRDIRRWYDTYLEIMVLGQPYILIIVGAFAFVLEILPWIKTVY